MALFDNGGPEEFLFFIINLNINLKASVLIKYGSNIQYLRTLVCGETFFQFETKSAEVGSDTPENFTSIILDLGT